LVTAEEDPTLPLSAFAAMREKRVNLGLRLVRQGVVRGEGLRGEKRENEGREEEEDEDEDEGQQHLAVALVERAPVGAAWLRPSISFSFSFSSPNKKIGFTYNISYLCV